MDKELFELCKEVFKRHPDWDYHATPHFANDFGEIKVLWDVEILSPAFSICPLYTSDYMLEKIETQMMMYELSYSPFKGRWELNRKKRYGVGRVIGETPLKALLKLVLVLDDSGELL